MNLLYICPTPEDATSWYRGVGPLGSLRAAHRELHPIHAPKYNWTTMAMVDAVFMQRPFSQEHLHVMQMAMDQGKKVWVDYDDDLFNVPTDNPSYRTYMKNQKTLGTIIASADEVSVSTARLAEALEPLRQGRSPSVVIPNAWNDRIFPGAFEKPRNPRDNDGRLIIWRGSPTHQRDLLIHAEHLANVARNHPKWKWMFVGWNPWFLTEALRPDSVSIVPAMDVMVYHDWMRKQRARVQIVPLANNAFNHSKSNCAWIEATMAGSLVVAPEWSEWKQPGVSNYGSAGMQHILERIIEEVEAENPMHSLVAESQKAVMENYRLSTLNERRWEIIERLK